VISFRPGPDPVGALVRHVLAAIAGDRRTDLSPTATELEAFRAQLRGAPTLLAARLTTIAHERGGRVSSAIDQLEEIFTQAPARRSGSSS